MSQFSSFFLSYLSFFRMIFKRVIIKKKH